MFVNVRLWLKSDDYSDICSLSGSGVVSGGDLVLDLKGDDEGDIGRGVLCVSAAGVVSGNIDSMDGGEVKTSVEVASGRSNLDYFYRKAKQSPQPAGSSSSVEMWHGTPIMFLSDEAKFEYYFGELVGELKKKNVGGLSFISGLSRAGGMLGERVLVVDSSGHVLATDTVGYLSPEDVDSGEGSEDVTGEDVFVEEDVSPPSTSRLPVYLEDGGLFVQKPDGLYDFFVYSEVMGLLGGDPVSMTPAEIFNIIYGVYNPFNPFSGVEKGDVSSGESPEIVIDEVGNPRYSNGGRVFGKGNVVLDEDQNPVMDYDAATKIINKVNSLLGYVNGFLSGKKTIDGTMVVGYQPFHYHLSVADSNADEFCVGNMMEYCDLGDGNHRVSLGLQATYKGMLHKLLGGVANNPEVKKILDKINNPFLHQAVASLTKIDGDVDIGIKPFYLENRGRNVTLGGELFHFETQACYGDSCWGPTAALGIDYATIRYDKSSKTKTATIYPFSFMTADAVNRMVHNESMWQPLYDENPQIKYNNEIFQDWEIEPKQFNLKYKVSYDNLSIPLTDMIIDYPTLGNKTVIDSTIYFEGTNLTNSTKSFYVNERKKMDTPSSVSIWEQITTLMGNIFRWG